MCFVNEFDFLKFWFFVSVFICINLPFLVKCLNYFVIWLLPGGPAQKLSGLLPAQQRKAEVLTVKVIASALSTLAKEN